jgi:predicted O-methyltransferase YrrM
VKVEAVRERVGSTPMMTLEQAHAITRFVAQHDLHDLLELGFAHGVSTCYLAGALEEIGGGHLTSIDQESARSRDPNADALLARTGLSRFVTLIYDATSYAWRLGRMLEADPTPRFDFCYLDGAHTWLADGFAFLLVDRLLVPGGWIVFDDLDWIAPPDPERPAPAELAVPQVRMVYDLLVKTHPSYDHFIERDGWAYAHKSDAAGSGALAVRREVVHEIGLQKLYHWLRRQRRSNP